MKVTTAFLICLLVFTVVFGLSATLLWYFEEVKDLEYSGKTVLDNRIIHNLEPTFVDNRIIHNAEPTFV